VRRAVLSCALLAAALLDSARLAAQEVNGWTDRQFEFALGGDSLLRATIRPMVYRDASVIAELHRVGVANGCPAIGSALDAALAAHESEYRSWALPTLRQIITPAEAASPAGSIAPAGFHEQLGRRLMLRMRRERPELLAGVEADAIRAAREKVASLPAVDGDWRGRFADWDFERAPGLTHQIACSIEAHADPDQGKQVFDGFYKIGGNKHVPDAD